jgi:hypothetical protein
MATMMITPERELHEYILEISERTDVRAGSPLPLGTQASRAQPALGVTWRPEGPPVERRYYRTTQRVRALTELLSGGIYASLRRTRCGLQALLTQRPDGCETALGATFGAPATASF